MTDDHKAVLAIIVCIFGVLAYSFGLPYLKRFWLMYVQVEGYLTHMMSFTAEIKEQSRLLMEWTEVSTAQSVTERKFYMIRNHILFYGTHNYIISAVLLFISFLIYKKWDLYSGMPSLTTLLNTEYKVWPALEFVRRFDPFKHWKELRGVGRYSLSPFVFSVENKILKNYKKPSKKDRVFDEIRAYEVGEKLLGKEFSSYQNLDPIYKAHVALVVAKELSVSSDPKDKKKGFVRYDELLRYFAVEFSDVDQNRSSFYKYLNEVLNPLMVVLDTRKVPNKSRVDVINDMNKWLISNDKKVQKLKLHEDYGVRDSELDRFTKYKNKFYYDITLMIGMNREVKRKGKFPPGRLVFFKAWDRNLFLTISNVPYYVSDRPFFFVKGFSPEVMIQFSHYQHESFAKRKLDQPYIGTFVSSLKKELIQKNIIEI